MLADQPETGDVLEAQLTVRPKPPFHIATYRNLTRFARTKPLAFSGGVVLAIMVIIAFLTRYAGLAPYDPEQVGVATKFGAPGADLILGTDQLGRDILSRIMYGTWISLKVGLLSTLIGISLGTIIGIFSAYAGGMIDLIVQRIVDALMAFPPIILALGLMAALGASDTNVIIALIAILVPGATRVIRSQALSIKELDYTLAARAIGATAGRVVWKHILPNVMATYIVLITITVGFAIIVEAALSFLGVGVPPDVPTWGGMLQLGRKYIDVTSWLAVFPGIAISLVVFSVNFLGDGLRDVLDPKLRGR
ncbi:MAG TPA: ABC transporter permease [Dehalococcoidia bacterium]|nr:ABC transporter permease [Chloroflexota bacterium]MQF96323.1 ABC transporter permease [SAR202 cluster bacterium]HCL24886.1 ABC transporter permease [Dehalococcoidia bacterium]